MAVEYRASTNMDMEESKIGYKLFLMDGNNISYSGKIEKICPVNMLVWNLPECCGDECLFYIIYSYQLEQLVLSLII